jgi:hypothetical protein
MLQELGWRRPLPAAGHARLPEITWHAGVVKLCSINIGHDTCADMDRGEPDEWQLDPRT